MKQTNFWQVLLALEIGELHLELFPFSLRGGLESSRPETYAKQKLRFN